LQVWVKVRASRHETGKEEPTAAQAGASEERDVGKVWTRREGRAVFMCWESGEGLFRPTLPDWGDAKPSCANTDKQITRYISIRKEIKVVDLAKLF